MPTGKYIKKHWLYIVLLVALFTSLTIPALGIPVSEPASAGGLWEVDGTETQLITADDIDMQTQKIINLVDPVANQDAATKKYVDDSIDTDVATHAALTATHGVAEIAGIADIDTHAALTATHGVAEIAGIADIATHAALTATHGVSGTILGTEDVDDTPVDGATTDPISSNWAYDFDLETAAALAGRTKVSQGDKTIYLDKDASGANDGTSWTDAFESWADCLVYLKGYVIAHNWIVKVRAATTPYREIFDCYGFTVWGTLTIEAEYYWYGNCEAQATAGNVKDTSADFSNVEVGDKVYLIWLDSGDGNTGDDYEMCTVDDISQAGSGILGTDGAKTATTDWDYVICKTEISGSDDGTDGGTARNYCLYTISVDKVYIAGFYLTFSDDAAVWWENSRASKLDYCILDETDGGVYATVNSKLNATYLYIEAPVRFGLLSGEISYVDCRYSAITNCNGMGYGVYGYRMAACLFAYSIIDDCDYAVRCDDFSWIFLSNIEITANSPVGIYASYNAVCKLTNVDNNGVDAVDPDGTTDNPYIGA